MAERPLFSTKGSRVMNNDWSPKRLLVFEDRVEMKDPGLLKTQTQVMRYEQIAQVGVRSGFFYADLVIESRGGGSIVLKRLSRSAAKLAGRLINERLGRSFFPATPTEAPNERRDVPELLRELAQLREAGILTEEEFEAQKRKILDS